MFNSIFGGTLFQGNSYLYNTIWIFLIISILGWCVESAYMSFCNGKITNRGFIKAPICPIYGMGEFIVYTVLQPFAGNYVVLYIAGALLATAFEFLTANLMMHYLGFVWWDYTNKPFNYKGIICLESTLAWGVYSIVDFAFLHNFILNQFVARIPVVIGTVMAPVLLLYVLAATVRRGKKVLQGEVVIEQNNLMAAGTVNKK